MKGHITEEELIRQISREFDSAGVGFRLEYQIPTLTKRRLDFYISFPYRAFIELAIKEKSVAFNQHHTKLGFLKQFLPILDQQLFRY